MPIDDGEYQPREADEIRESFLTELHANLENPATNESDLLYAIFHAAAAALAEHQEFDMRDLYDSAYLDTATDEELTMKARELGVERRSPVRATGVVTFMRGEPAPDDYIIRSGTNVRTLSDDPVTFQTTETATLDTGTTEVDVMVEALEGGTQGNVGAERIRAMPSPPTGVDEVTNPIPTGDYTYEGLDGEPLRQGEDRETDEQLRERAFNSMAIGGAATVNAIESSIRDLNGVESVTIFTNPTPETDDDGMAPYSLEVIVHGGNGGTIAQTLYEQVAVTELGRLQHGIRGDPEEYPIESNTLDQVIDIRFSRPEEVLLSMTIDLVHDETYAGDDEVRDRIVRYVGGVTSESETIIGTDVGEDVYIDKIKSNITNAVTDKTGVIGISELSIDIDNDEINDTETDASGLEIIPIAENQVARTLGDDATITINKTEV